MVFKLYPIKKVIYIKEIHKLYKHNPSNQNLYNFHGAKEQCKVLARAFYDEYISRAQCWAFKPSLLKPNQNFKKMRLNALRCSLLLLTALYQPVICLPNILRQCLFRILLSLQIFSLDRNICLPSCKLIKENVLKKLSILESYKESGSVRAHVPAPVPCPFCWTAWYLPRIYKVLYLSLCKAIDLRSSTTVHFLFCILSRKCFESLVLD
jgi:hypothetical protein